MDEESEGLPYLNDEEKDKAQAAKAQEYYEIQRKKEERANHKLKRQTIKAQCIMAAISLVKDNPDLDVLTEARKYYAWIRS